MDINSDKVTQLLERIEIVRRRKIVDKGRQEIVYIDPMNNIDKIVVQNNNIILGRRGCGKTTIMLSAINKVENRTCVAIDCQTYRKYSRDEIITKLLNKIMDAVQYDLYDLLEKCRSDSNFLEKLRKEYRDGVKLIELFLAAVQNMFTIVEQIKDMPNQITYTTKISQKVESKLEENSGFKTEGNAEASISFKVQAKYNKLNAKMAGISNITTGYSRDVKKINASNTTKEVAAEEERVETKENVLLGLIEVMSDLFTEYKEITNKGIALYLDDFYQIAIETQTPIIHYFHDIYKNCEDGAFCFKICTLPNRIKLNYDGESILSSKDDFSTVNLDKDLSEIESIKRYLVQILCSIDKDLGITSREIENLFATEGLITLINASGGIPRDFLIMFADAVKECRATNKNTIGKASIYNVVNTMRQDKDENIEFDTVITLEMITEVMHQIEKAIIEKANTNIFLFPQKASDRHAKIMKNLVNTRYLHVIKEATSSENKKKEMFTAYLIDMSFYIKGKQIKRGFEPKPFWEKDERYRLKYIESAPIFKLEETEH